MSEEAKAGATAYLLERFSDARQNSRSLFRFFLRNAQAKHGVPHEADAPPQDTLAIATIALSAQRSAQEAQATANLAAERAAAAERQREQARTVQAETSAPSTSVAGPVSSAAQRTGDPSDTTGRWRSAYPWLVAAGVGATGLLAYGLGQMGKDDAKEVASQGEGGEATDHEHEGSSSSTAIGIDIHEADRSQSPLQWLEDIGKNRP